MYRLFPWVCLIVFSSSTISIAFGESYNFQSPTITQPKSLPKVNIPARHPVSSAADFKKSVSAANLKEQGDLSQQASEKMKSMQGNRKNKTPANQTTPPAQKSPKTMGNPQQSPSQEQYTPTFEEPIAGQKTPSLPSSPKTTITPIPTPAQPQTPPPQIYTGFPNETKPTNQPTQNQNPQGNSGWNIQY